MSPIATSCFGDYYDGARAVRQRVSITEDHGTYGDVLMLELPDGEHVVLWPCDQVRTLPDQSSYDTLTMGLEGGDGARLVVRDPDGCAMIAAACPHIERTLAPPSKWPLALGIAGLGSIAVVALFVFVLPLVAGFLASRTTPEAEVAMGEANFDLTRSAFSRGQDPLPICIAAPGLAAMQKITDRVTGGLDLPYPMRVAVLDDSANPVPNAYALPGGYITFFDSLIQLSQDPDEIAAVYAHELGHVVLDHSVKNILQSMTTFALITLISGDVTGAAGFGSSLISAGYSRAAETEADVYAQERLTEVDLPPAALGTLFARMSEGRPVQQGLLAHLSTHPEFSERIMAAAAADTGVRGAPVLSPEEWEDLRRICDETRS